MDPPAEPTSAASTASVAMPEPTTPKPGKRRASRKSSVPTSPTAASVAEESCSSQPSAAPGTPSEAPTSVKVEAPERGGGRGRGGKRKAQQGAGGEPEGKIGKGGRGRGGSRKVAKPAPEPEEEPPDLGPVGVQPLRPFNCWQYRCTPCAPLTLRPDVHVPPPALEAGKASPNSHHHVGTTSILPTPAAVAAVL